MKKTINTIFLLLVFVLSARAQDVFEGTIRWSVKMEYTDPEQAAKLKQIVAEFSSPEGVQKLKNIEQKMKDTTFRRYLEGNPAMKTQIENGMAMMKIVQENPGEDPVTLMVPKNIILNVKKPRSLIQMEGGISELIGNLLSDSTGKRYSIKAKDKKYSKIPEYKDSSAATAKIIPTKEVEKILNYTCKKYIVEAEVKGKKVKQLIWTTKDVKSFNTNLLADLNVGNNATGIDFSKIEGIPLKMVITNEETITTFTAVELKAGKVDPSLFVIPKEYKEVPYVKMGK